jgi:hypothetical protein
MMALCTSLLSRLLLQELNDGGVDTSEDDASKRIRAEAPAKTAVQLAQEKVSNIRFSERAPKRFQLSASMLGPPVH